MTNTDARHPYQDASLSPEQRVDDLLSRMDVADKAGMLFHTMVGFGDPEESNPTFGIPSVASMVRRRRMTHFNILGAAPTGKPSVFARLQAAYEAEAAKGMAGA